MGKLRTGFTSLVVAALVTLGLVACSEGKVLEVEIEPKLATHAECGGLDPGIRCMMMHGPDGREALHEGIEGFSYEEGYTWTLKVRLTKPWGGTPPQTEMSSHVYTLIEVISKVPVE